MLYKGTQQDYQNQIADHAEHEDVLRGDGWSDYVDLPESEPDMKYASGSGVGDTSAEPSKSQEIDLSAFVPIEQFDAVAEKLAQSESEVARLNGVIKNGMEENEQLRSRIAELEVPVSMGATSEPVQAEQPIDYSSMTADQLRVLLDEKEIKYLARDNKDTLISLLEQPVNTEE
jgi:predicted GIY-YIG superfamily endonuclease